MPTKNSENDAFQQWRETGEGIENLTELLKLHAHKVTRQVLKDADDDIAMEAICKVLEKGKTFKDESQFSSWFHAIVVNLCKDELRRRKQRAEVPLSEAEEGWSQRHWGPLIEKLKERISPTEAKFFDLWTLQGLSEPQLVKEMQMTFQQVHNMKELIRYQARKLYANETSK